MTLLNVNDDKEVGDLLLERMLLKVHQFNFDKIQVYGDPKEVILDYSKENDLDLIVLGAYGRDKITVYFLVIRPR